MKRNSRVVVVVKININILDENPGIKEYKHRLSNQGLQTEKCQASHNGRNHVRNNEHTDICKQYIKQLSELV